MQRNDYLNRLYYRPILLRPFSDLEWQAQISTVDADACAPVLDALIPLLDGTRSLEEICGELLLIGFQPASIFRALELLDQHGFIGEPPDSEANELTGSELERYRLQMQLLAMHGQGQELGTSSAWQRAGGPAQVALKKAHVLLVHTGIVGSNLVRLLALAGVGRLTGMQTDAHSMRPEAGAWCEPSRIRQSVSQLNPFVQFRTIEDGEQFLSSLEAAQTSIVVYCPDAFDEELCKRLNASCLRCTVPLLVYRQTAFEVTLGPLMVPRETACYVCYERRRKALISVLGTRRVPEKVNQARLNFVLGVDWLAMETIKYLTGVAEPITRGRICQLDFLRGLPDVHPVLKLPRCPACGVHKVRPPRKLWDE